MSLALVFSDVHAHDKALKKILLVAENNGASMILFAGDMGFSNPAMSLILASRKVPMLCVRGNCDWNWDSEGACLPEAGLYLTYRLNGRLIFMTHGHRYVLPETVGLKSEKGMIVITGHTHVPLLRFENGIYTLNPGSAGRPRGKWGASYALIDEKGIKIKELYLGRTIAEVQFSDNRSF